MNSRYIGDAAGLSGHGLTWRSRLGAPWAEKGGAGVLIHIVLLRFELLLLL